MENTLSSQDLASSNLASYCPDLLSFVDDSDREFLEFCEQFHPQLTVLVLDKLQMVLSIIFSTVIARENTRQAVTALMISIGLGNYHEISMEAHAQQLGVTKASVSKEVTIMRDVFLRSMNDQAAFGSLKSRKVRNISRAAQLAHYGRVREEKSNS